MSETSVQLPDVDARQIPVITDDQVKFFLDYGFLVIRNVLVGEELSQIQEAMMSLYEQGVAGVKNDPDFMYGKGVKTGGVILRRIEYVIDKSDVMKSLLGHPFILRTVEKVQGNSFIPTWDSMVMKAPNEGIEVPWHRDSELPDGCEDPRPIFNVDFYLDAADLSTCLWVIPGSHLWTHEQSQARCKQPGFDTSDAIPVPMNPGDVILHNIMVLHGSPEGDGNPLRRTVYYEFRPGEIELEFGPHTAEYLGLKQQVLHQCIEQRKQQPYARGENSFQYSPSGELAIKEIVPPATYRYPHRMYWR